MLPINVLNEGLKFGVLLLNTLKYEIGLFLDEDKFQVKLILLSDSALPLKLTSSGS